ncbi:MAG TPA: acyl carrier protein [Candidatus Polarisedimenticolia bacterium]|nr:acyl carrier protein [Candidatus Polarisedimenticolia bacterium]
MDEVKDRLVKCFQTVFPDMPEADILLSSQASVSAWDSIAAITLVNVIEDEFGFAIDFEALPDLNSFDLVLRYVQTQFTGLKS